MHLRVTKGAFAEMTRRRIALPGVTLAIRHSDARAMADGTTHHFLAHRHAVRWPECAPFIGLVVVLDAAGTVVGAHWHRITRARPLVVEAAGVA